MTINRPNRSHFYFKTAALGGLSLTNTHLQVFRRAQLNVCVTRLPQPSASAHVAGMLEPYEYIKAEPAKEDGTDGETDLDGSDGLCLGVGMDLVDIGLVVP